MFIAYRKIGIINQVKIQEWRLWLKTSDISLFSKLKKTIISVISDPKSRNEIIKNLHANLLGGTPVYTAHIKDRGRAFQLKI